MANRVELPDQIQARLTEDSNGCWLWDRPSSDGYARVSFRGKRWLVHRLTHTLVTGEIPAGLQVDHLCRVTHCVNPDHLEAVTPLVNTRRSQGNNSKTHCPRGHEYTPENTLCRKDRLHRECKTCTYARNQAADKARGYRRPSRSKEAA